MFCLKCGKEIADDALYCPHCNCPTENAAVTSVSSAMNAEPSGKTTANFGLISVILGAIGIVMAWLIAILGYLFGGGALALAIIGKIKDNNRKRANLGLVLAIMTLVFSFLNSILGIILMMQ